MEIIQEFQAYIAAQKAVGFQFIILGVSLIVIAGISQITSESALANGLKIGALVCGILIIAGGIGYRITETNLLREQSDLHKENHVEFQHVETERMAKVKKDYPVYQVVFSIITVLSLVVILFVGNSYWQGIAFAIVILMVGVMIIEAFSQLSINSYYESLLK